MLFAYLTSHNYDFAYDKSHAVRPRRNIRQAMQHEISMYAVAQSTFLRSNVCLHFNKHK